MENIECHAVLREVHGDGLGYIQWVLAGLGRRLSAFLLELPLEEGSVRAILPASEMPLEDEFRRGGRTIVGASKLFLEIVARYLATSSTSFFVCDNGMARADDRPLKPLQNFFTCGQDVYHLAEAGSNLKKIEEVSRASHSFYTCHILGKPWPGDVPPEGAELSEDHLRLIANNTEYIIISAYDRESWVFWGRPGATRLSTTF